MSSDTTDIINKVSHPYELAKTRWLSSLNKYIPRVFHGIGINGPYNPYEPYDSTSIMKDWNKAQPSTEINDVLINETYNRWHIENECIRESPPMRIKTLMEEEKLRRYNITRSIEYVYQLLVQRYTDEYHTSSPDE